MSTDTITHSRIMIQPQTFDGFSEGRQYAGMSWFDRAVKSPNALACERVFTTIAAATNKLHEVALTCAMTKY